MVLVTTALASAQPEKQLATIKSLDSLYKLGKIDTKTFLAHTDSATLNCIPDSAIIQALSTFREIAFSSEKHMQYQARYYYTRAFYEESNGRFGGSVFYLEKSLAIAKKFHFTRIYVNALALLIETNNSMSRYDRSLVYYKELSDFIDKEYKGKELPDYEFASVIGVYELAAFEFHESKQCTEVDKCIRNIEQMLSRRKKLAPAYNDLVHSYYLMAASMADDCNHDTAQQNAKLSELWNWVNRPEYNANAKNTAMLNAAIANADFAFEKKRWPKFQYFRNYLMNNLPPTYLRPISLHYDTVIARQMLASGKHEEAARLMLKSLRNYDTVAGETIRDQQANAYSQAANDDAQNRLLVLENNKRLNERKLFMIGGLALVLLVIAGIAIASLRIKQKRRLLDEKIALAGEIHDHLGPMVYYCRMLVKDQLRKEVSTDQPHNLLELQRYLHETGENIRGLAMELRRKGSCTLEALKESVIELLERQKALEGTNYTIHGEVPDKTLSMSQFMELQKCLQELLHNSFKHAPGEEIHIDFKVVNAGLVIDFWDTGKGFDTNKNTNTAPGSGLKSIRERIEKLGGKVELINNFPNGYRTHLTAKL